MQAKANAFELFLMTVEELGEFSVFPGCCDSLFHARSQHTAWLLEMLAQAQQTWIPGEASKA